MNWKKFSPLCEFEIVCKCTNRIQFLKNSIWCAFFKIFKWINRGNEKIRFRLRVVPTMTLILGEINVRLNRALNRFTIICTCKSWTLFNSLWKFEFCVIHCEHEMKLLTKGQTFSIPHSNSLRASSQITVHVSFYLKCTILDLQSPHSHGHTLYALLQYQLYLKMKTNNSEQKTEQMRTYRWHCMVWMGCSGCLPTMRFLSSDSSKLNTFSWNPLSGK